MLICLEHLPDLKAELLAIIKRHAILSVNKDTYEPAPFLRLQLDLNKINTVGMKQWLNGVRHTSK
jgi:hypothetical protein